MISWPVARATAREKLRSPAILVVGACFVAAAALGGRAGAVGETFGGFGVAWGMSRSITRLSVRLRDVHAHLDHDTIIGGQGGVLNGKHVRGREVLWGTPVRPLKEFLLQQAYLARLAKRKFE